jgi:ABC transporter substrate binding protein (PQQ-dependent alcohol dehydrogenase system)
MRYVIHLVVALGVWLTPWVADAQEATQRFSIVVLRQLAEVPPWISQLETRPDDEGFAGARLAVQDNETTGRFLKQSFGLRVEVIPFGGDPLPVFEELLADGESYFVLDVPAKDAIRIADAAKGRDVVLFNAGASDDSLRGVSCRDNLLHTAPSRAMLSDALAQYFALKRWRRWLLIVGRREEDRLYAEALRRAAGKFGLRVVAEKIWDFGPDSNRTAQAEVPPFTQGIDYDVAIIADEFGEFGDLILYRTWDPRPTAGTQGLSPVSWHPTLEQWGAVQFQNRFIRSAKRPMRPLDYQMWLAVRTVGEGATRTRSADVSAIRTYIRGPTFELAAFKGVALSFRDWDWQLRQPILLAHPAAVVSVSPQAGFLHQRTPLDTLGIDKPESTCPLAAESKQ